MIRAADISGMSTRSPRLARTLITAAIGLATVGTLAGCDSVTFREVDHGTVTHKAFRASTTSLIMVGDVLVPMESGDQYILTVQDCPGDGYCYTDQKNVDEDAWYAYEEGDEYPGN
jgi:hypothetical protein